MFAMAVQVNIWDEAMKKKANSYMAARADQDQEYREKRMAAANSRNQLGVESEGPFAFSPAGKELRCDKSLYSLFV